MFRVGRTARDIARPEILLIRRAPGRILPGLWQCVSGSLEPGERVAAGRAPRARRGDRLRPAPTSRRFYDLDLVNQFHEPSVDAIVTAAVFAVRLRPDAEPRLSHEHDGATWHALEEAHEQVIWPGYRTAIERIRDDLSDPERAAWFELTLDGQRARGGSRGRPVWPAGRLGPVIEQEDRSRRLREPSRRAPPSAAIFHSKVDTIRPTYGFEDVSLAPGTDTIEPADVDLAQTFCGIDLAIPILASAMDAVVDAADGRRAGAARRAGDPQPRGRPDALRRSGRRPRADRDGRRRRRPGAPRRGLPGSRSARTSSPAGSTRSTPRGRRPRSRRRPARPAGSGRSAPSTAPTCSSSRARSRRPATSRPSTTRCRSPSSPATCRSRSRSATRPTPRPPSR